MSQTFIGSIHARNPNHMKTCISFSDFVTGPCAKTDSLQDDGGLRLMAAAPP